MMHLECSLTLICCGLLFGADYRARGKTDLSLPTSAGQKVQDEKRHPKNNPGCPRDMVAAAQVLSSALGEVGGGGGDVGSRLSTPLWTELLD